MFLLVRVLSMDYEKVMLTYLKADKKRIAHTYGVKQRALELGKKYQADLEVLKSCLLHDITKLLTLKEHQKLINDDLLFSHRAVYVSCLFRLSISETTKYY